MPMPDQETLADQLPEFPPKRPKSGSIRHPAELHQATVDDPIAPRFKRGFEVVQNVEGNKALATQSGTCPRVRLACRCHGWIFRQADWCDVWGPVAAAGVSGCATRSREKEVEKTLNIQGLIIVFTMNMTQK